MTKDKSAKYHPHYLKIRGQQHYLPEKFLFVGAAVKHAMSIVKKKQIIDVYVKRTYYKKVLTITEESKNSFKFNERCGTVPDDTNTNFFDKLIKK